MPQKSWMAYSGVSIKKEHICSHSAFPQFPSLFPVEIHRKVVSMVM